MVTKVSVATFLQYQQQGIPVLDVRSPGEYKQGHIPGADSFPLFDDQERKEVGTLYKKAGPEKAFLVGLDYVGKKMSTYVKKASSLRSKSLLLHCWRGGKRSESMAWLLSQAGYTCFVLEGGYRAYRTYIREALESMTNFMVLGGMTGSNKTGILQEMKKQGMQVVDLEGLAHHKGSAFGHINEPEQPTTEQFENNLFASVQRMDPDRLIWLEDESRTIGRVVMPEKFYLHKKLAPLLVLEVPLSSRVDHLVANYAQINDDYLLNALEKIKKRLGGDRYNKCVHALERKDYHYVAEATLSYYDKAYSYAITSGRDLQKIHYLPLENTDPVEGAQKIISWFSDFLGRKE
ncbi:MAG: tRNA 2-selenouridine(34) synthase MnmH [Bacteroidetes bacterium]|nr:MAG: tRNA 2-selenouridine(34) synthase MnmH [Bacteroidota bacterium]PIE87803.1 MAG: tRNA 2-selenouridine(34) synthase MnmH [Bacteroidota bacterium]